MLVHFQLASGQRNVDKGSNYITISSFNFLWMQINIFPQLKIRKNIRANSSGRVPASLQCLATSAANLQDLPHAASYTLLTCNWIFSQILYYILHTTFAYINICSCLVDCETNRSRDTLLQSQFSIRHKPHTCKASAIMRKIKNKNYQNVVEPVLVTIRCV